MATCVMLVAIVTSDVNRHTIELTKLVLRKFDIKFEIVDGSVDEALQKDLFAVSQHKGTYPQLFRKDGDEYKFLATGDEVVRMNMNHDMLEEMIEDNPMFLEQHPGIKYIPHWFADFS
eukprot:TRINITY_DN21516_c0_g1_i1.p2 TRINITY_DN21516_c0_g1~~TRINITY_DN21516_c0_g1_i1.p2  ORF type:complete len:118 (+),score=22.89 TRINITY_DN21516_c0_g1_i1:49-402(+)